MKKIIEAIKELDKRMDELNDLKNMNNYKIREAEELKTTIQQDTNNNYPNKKTDIQKIDENIEYYENEIYYKEKQLMQYENMVIDLYIDIMNKNNYPEEANAIKKIKYNYVKRTDLLCGLLDKFVGVTTN